MGSDVIWKVMFQQARIAMWWCLQATFTNYKYELFIQNIIIETQKHSNAI